jgi:hypothetical protein
LLETRWKGKPDSCWQLVCIAARIRQLDSFRGVGAMGLFDDTAKRLTSRPALLLAADPAGEMADAVTDYDPGLRVRGDKFVFGNGVLLCGPVEITGEIARKAELPGGVTVAYYASVAVPGKSERRPDDDRWQDAQRLIRGLAARLGGVIRDPRPAMELTLEASVYSGRPLPVDAVVDVLRPFAGHDLEPGPMKVEGAYALRPVEGTVLFLTMYLPPWVSRVQPLPPAVGELRRKKPCQWELYTSVPVEHAKPEDCHTVGGAALALAGRTGGMVTDVYGFPVRRPEDLLPRHR